MFSSSFAAGCPLVQMTGIRLTQFEGTTNVPENRAQVDARAHATPLPEIVPFGSVAAGAMRATLVPKVGSVPAAPKAETNVAGIVSTVPELLSCRSPRRTVIDPATENRSFAC